MDNILLIHQQLEINGHVHTPFMLEVHLPLDGTSVQKKVHVPHQTINI